MHSEATDRRPRHVSIDGLARDVVVYPAVAVGLALVLGTVIGVPTAGMLATATLALGGVTVIVAGANDLADGVAAAYVTRDAAPTARAMAVLLATIVWAGAVVVVLAVA